VNSIEKLMLTYFLNKCGHI